MALVGDVIVRCRNQAGDPCQVIPAPGTITLASSGAGTLSGTIYGILTWLNPFGESLGSAEATVAGLSSNAVGISGVTAPPAATSANFYYSSTAGTEQQYFPISNLSSLVVGTAGSSPVQGTPPYKSSAHLPDTDGDLVSAYEIYRWLNAGMAELGRIAGGILDQTGVAMPSGSNDVVIPGYWLKIMYVWFNGWLALPTQQSYLWMQSTVLANPTITTVWKNSAQQIVAVWPTAGPAPAVTTLTADMSATDLSAAISSGLSFTAPGLCVIENEVLSYSIASGGHLTGMQRGYGGTVAAAHVQGTQVAEAIFRLQGRRLPVAISVGAARQSLDMPVGWDSVLDYYLLSKFKQTEQDVDEAAKLMQEFVGKAAALRPDEEAELSDLYTERQYRDGLMPVPGYSLPRRTPSSWIRPRPQRPVPPPARRRQRGEVPPESA